MGLGEPVFLFYHPTHLTARGEEELQWLLKEYPELYKNASAVLRAGVSVLARMKREQKLNGSGWNDHEVKE